MSGSSTMDTDALRRCPACDHPLLLAEAEALCPECGLARAAALAVDRRWLVNIWMALTLGAVARVIHAPALLVMHFGWFGRAGEWTLLVTRAGSATVAAAACLLLAQAMRRQRNERSVRATIARVGLRIVAIALVVIALEILARGLGAMAVVRLPTWYIRGLSEPPTAAVFAVLPLLGQVLASVALALVAWPLARGWRRWCLAFLLGFALAFVSFEVAVRAGALDPIDRAGVVASVWSYRLGMRVALDVLAAVALAVQWHPQRIARL